jgi:hypothetical protein
MRSGGKGMWALGPALYKHNYLKKRSLASAKNNEQEKNILPQKCGLVQGFIFSNS